MKATAAFVNDRTHATKTNLVHLLARGELVSRVKILRCAESPDLRGFSSMYPVVERAQQKGGKDSANMLNLQVIRGQHGDGGEGACSEKVC